MTNWHQLAAVTAAATTNVADTHHRQNGSFAEPAAKVDRIAFIIATYDSISTLIEFSVAIIAAVHPTEQQALTSSIDKFMKKK